MADPSPRPAARASGQRDAAPRRGSRWKVAGKLTALLGLPLLVIFSIFASGVYVGATRADRVVELEQRWFGIAPPEGRLEQTAEAVEPSAGDDASAGETGGEAPSEPEPAEPKPTQPEPTQPEPTEPKPTEPEPVAVEMIGGLPIASADPVGAELRTRFEEARVVRLKIMIDPALVVAREDWLSYIANLFEATRASFDRLFGIDLQLHGVVVWDAAVGADADTLLIDLAGRERDGADVVIGLIARAQPTDFTPARWTEDATGDRALVFADVQQSDRYYRNLLRALSLLFGAEPAHDSAAKQLGSYMSDAVPTVGAAPVLDPENRGKVIINKRRPIATPTPEPEPALDNPDQPANEGETI